MRKSCSLRLLDASFEEVGGLEEEGGDAAAAEAGGEVEDWTYIVSTVDQGEEGVREGGKSRRWIVLGAAFRFCCRAGTPFDIAMWCCIGLSHREKGKYPQKHRYRMLKSWISRS